MVREGFLHQSLVGGESELIKLNGGVFSPDHRYLMLLGGACNTGVLAVLRVDAVLKQVEQPPPQQPQQPQQQ
jgi:hypothetical protein